MYDNTNYKYSVFLILVLSVVGVIIKIFRKRFIKNLTMHTTVTLDVILTSFFVCLYMIIFKSYVNIVYELQNMPSHYWLINILISLLLASGIILGRFLLLRNRISYLEGIHISFDLLLSVILGTLILNEPLDKIKVIGMLFIIIGMVFINKHQIKAIM